MERRCAGCGAVLVKKPGPGRWPHRCDDCRPSASEQFVAVAKPCDICRMEFLPQHPTQRYCSRECKKKRPWQGRRPRICEICDVEYRPTYGEQRTCGRKCGMLLNVLLRPPRPSKPTIEPEGFTVVPWAQCITCRDWFIARMNRTGCTRNCRMGYIPRGIARVSTCIECGQQFMYPSRTRRKTLCSNDCRRRRAKRKAADPRRDRSHRQRAIRLGVPYEEVNRRTVYERDNWTCGLCGDAIDPQCKWPDEWCASIDHIIPMSKGGGHLYSNVQAAHWWCNTMKGVDEGFDLHAA